MADAVAEAMAVDGGDDKKRAPARKKYARLVLLAELVGHDGRVWGLDWSPEGDTLASCGADRTVRTWHCVGKSRNSKLEGRWLPDAVLEESQARAVRAVAWAPPPPPLPPLPAAASSAAASSAARRRLLLSRRRRRRLAAASFDASVAVWEEERPPPPPSPPPSGGGIDDDNDVGNDDIDKDEEGEDDDEPTLWSQVALLQGHESEVKGVAWSPLPGAEQEEEQDPGSSSEEESGGEREEKDAAPAAAAPAAAAAPTTTTTSTPPSSLLGDGEGCLLATCGRDRSVWIWESVPSSSSMVSGGGGGGGPCEFECVDVKQGHSGDVKAVAWHPSGSVLASASYDGTVRLWVPEGGASEAGFGGGGAGGGGAGGISGNINIAAAAADEWLCAQEVKGAHGGETVWSIAFEPRVRRRRRKNRTTISGVRAATCGGDGRVSVWECPLPSGVRGEGEEEETTSPPSHSSPTERLSWKPGAVARSLPSRPLGGRVRPAYSVDWSRCGRWIASGGGDDAVRVFRAPARGGEQEKVEQEEAKGDDGGGGGGAGAGGGGTVLELAAEARPTTPCEINCVRWRPRTRGSKGDPPVLAAACDDGVVRLWKLVEE